MPLSLQDFDSAARLREAVSAIAGDVLDRAAPRPRYGTVLSVNISTRQVTLQYPDEAAAVTLQGNSILPVPGGAVRVSGPSGGRYIDDVLSGGVQFSGSVAMPFGVSIGGGLTVDDITASGPIVTPSLTTGPISATVVTAVSLSGAGAGITAVPIVAGTTGTLTLDRGGTGAIDGAGARTAIGLTTMSTAASLSTIVQRTADGYVYANYFNTTSEIKPAGTGFWPQYIAGRDAADSFIRWYRNLSGQVIQGALGTDSASSAITNIYTANTISSRSNIQAYGNLVAGATGIGQLGANRNGGSAGAQANTDSHNDASIFINPGWTLSGTGLTASIGFHPGGVAPQLRVGYGIDKIYVRGSDGVATSTLEGELIDTSSRRYKQNISSWPGKSLSAGALDPVTIVRALRPVKFQYDEKGALSEVMSERREKALKRLNDYAERTGNEKYERPLHDCAKNDCKGTVDDPCQRVVKHQTGKLGFIAEEIVDLIPEAVSLDENKQPSGLSATAMLAVVVSAFQGAMDRIEALEAQLAAR